MEYYFRKMWNNIGESCIVVFEAQKFAKPIFILEGHQVNALMNEWKTKFENSLTVKLLRDLHRESKKLT